MATSDGMFDDMLLLKIWLAGACMSAGTGEASHFRESIMCPALRAVDARVV